MCLPDWHVLGSLNTKHHALCKSNHAAPQGWPGPTLDKLSGISCLSPRYLALYWSSRKARSISLSASVLASSSIINCFDQEETAGWSDAESQSAAPVSLVLQFLRGRYFFQWFARCSAAFRLNFSALVISWVGIFPILPINVVYSLQSYVS